MTAEIVLPAGTQFVPLFDLPYLIAQALAPILPRDPLTFSHFLKTARSRVATEPPDLGGLPFGDDEKKALRQIWAHLPPIPNEATEDQIRPYIDAFNERGREFDWDLVVYWNVPKFPDYTQLYAVEGQYRKLIDDAIRRGYLKPLSGYTHKPCNEYDVNAVLPIGELVNYVRRFEITVRFRASSNDDVDIETKPDEEHQIAVRYSLENAASEIAQFTGIRLDKVMKALVVAVEAAEIPVYRPGENLKCRPDTLLDFCEEAYGEHLNAWLARFNPPIEWRFPKFRVGRPTPKSAPEENSKAKSKPLSRQRWQEQEIIRVLSEGGFDPLCLPNNLSGKAGVRKWTRLRLPEFTDAVHKLAWERMLKAGQLKFAGPTLKKKPSK